MRNRKVSIELLRCLLMLGICMCHSVGAGGHMCEPVRNVFMMCTVGFIFISGWFGVRCTMKRLLNLAVMAAFATVTVMAEDRLLNGHLTQSPLSIASQWWFLNAYVALLLLSPIFNSIANGLASTNPKIRHDAYISTGIFAFVLFALAWPMKCGWISPIRFVCTWGFPAQFGTMCTIYLLARMIALSGICDRVNKYVAMLCIVIPALFAIVGIKFTYYNSPFDFMFAFGVFWFFKRLEIKNVTVARLTMLVAPSMFFVYLYHSHQTPGFVILEKFQTWMVEGGIPVFLAWVLTGASIFVIGVSIDSIMRGMVSACIAFRSGRRCANQ